MTHTPGPWKASPTYPPGDWCIHAAGIPWQLACLLRSAQVEWPLEANARLIAAAPDLLEGHRQIIHVIQQMAAVHDMGVMDAVMDIARAAIAEAEGRT